MAEISYRVEALWTKWGTDPLKISFDPLTCEIPFASAIVLLGREECARHAFTSFPSSFDCNMTSRRGIRLCQSYDETRATTVAPGVERGNTARFPQC